MSVPNGLSGTDLKTDKIRLAVEHTWNKERKELLRTAYSCTRLYEYALARGMLVLVIGGWHGNSNPVSPTVVWPCQRHIGHEMVVHASLLHL
jgi:hypothetical protein